MEKSIKKRLILRLKKFYKMRITTGFMNPQRKIMDFYLGSIIISILIGIVTFIDAKNSFIANTPYISFIFPFIMFIFLFVFVITGFKFSLILLKDERESRSILFIPSLIFAGLFALFFLLWTLESFRYIPSIICLSYFFSSVVTLLLLLILNIIYYIAFYRSKI